MEKVINVAQYIFNEYNKMTGTVIDEMKLHKLLYFAQRESLAILGEPMFSEPFEGWVYGPVCRCVRWCYTPDGMYSDDIEDISLENAYIVKNVVTQYGAYETWKLSELSHKELSWRNSRIGISPQEHGNNILSIDDIRKDSEKIRPYDSVWDMFYDEFDDAED